MAHPDLDDLLNHLVVPAQRQLEARGDFEPFAAVLSAQGELQLFEGDASGEETEGGRSGVLRLLERGLRDISKEEELRAVGVCWLAKVERGTSTVRHPAIAAGLEHSEGEAVNVFQTFERSELDGEVHFDELFAAAREQSVFGQTPHRGLRLLDPLGPTQDSPPVS
ncbi:MAG: hypothetical protein AAF368_14455 [Planctomycetota bacterium]